MPQLTPSTILQGIIRIEISFNLSGRKNNLEPKTWSLMMINFFCFLQRTSIRFLAPCTRERWSWWIKFAVASFPCSVDLQSPLQLSQRCQLLNLWFCWKKSFKCGPAKRIHRESYFMIPVSTSWLSCNVNGRLPMILYTDGYCLGPDTYSFLLMQTELCSGSGCVMISKLVKNVATPAPAQPRLITTPGDWVNWEQCQSSNRYTCNPAPRYWHLLPSWHPHSAIITKKCEESPVV